MRIFNKVIGILLVLVGLYFLGQNIIFTTETSPYFGGVSLGDRDWSYLVNIFQTRDWMDGRYIYCLWNYPCFY